MFSANSSQPPRLKWCMFTALLGEWPTGCKLRHWSDAPHIKPTCRFCGTHDDCVKHWFGPSPCLALIDKIGRSSPLGSLDLTNGWFHRPADHEPVAWTLLFTAVYAVHSLLRWNLGADDNHTAGLREGVWLARCHELELSKNQLLEQLARKQASSRQRRHRLKVKKAQLALDLTTCRHCGQVWTVAVAHVCPLV